ncbi:capsid decoration protein [Mycobacterium phage Simpliphy]|uniref:Head fiber protein n=1 Tax=Mycobacterium Phage Xandras TaxID=3158891 RepID=A0AAU8GMJ8_9CAUD|nr:hypothetical protein SEA_NOSLEEP_20 [Mycobacterium phage NoSleep]AXH50556.1 capsid decoration protein [Mycobacterium phage Simpliphy]QAY05208.1 tail assembly chaperone [Mycobacterium phage Czyszczon1]QBJ04919.1 hypothetical protein SEA_MOLDEMORT_20 [Mycobacterium phage Moldemort]UTN92741.1 capsid decoration protein [Mycobacterium Phage Bench]WNO26103.1 head fiber protein [Mycobacterium phage Saints25]WNO28465.1 head fiber protein [Mycobacterium phage Highbury]
MAYTPKTWADGVDGGTPITAAELNRMEAGIEGATETAEDHTHTASEISDATSVGRSVLTATDAATARTAIGAGTSSLQLGTSGTTAAAGDHTHTGFVPTSRTVNGKALSGNVTLTGADVALTGYTAGTADNVAATDTVIAAIAKLEARIAELEAVAV